MYAPEVTLDDDMHLIRYLLEYCVPYSYLKKIYENYMVFYRWIEIVLCLTN